MAKAAKPKPQEVELVIQMIERRFATFYLYGNDFIMHRMSEKARQQLLFPPPPKNTAELAQNLKHNPLEEYRECIYRTREDLQKKQGTFIHMPHGMFKGTLSNAALDVPGTAKAQIERLTTISSVHVPMWGIPELHMGVVKVGGYPKTPDIRTRAIFREWCAKVEVGYIPLRGITHDNIAALFAMAGMVCGVGDWRPEKGGSYGQFTIVSPDDPDYVRVQKEMGLEAQRFAFENPQCYDTESESLFSWFNEELARRERLPKPEPKKKTTRRKNGGQPDEGVEVHAQ